MSLELDTEKRVAYLLAQMRKAMPEIRRQIAVYEKRMKSGKLIKPTMINTLSKNA